MKTLDELVNDVKDVRLAFALGGVAIAYSDRTRARQKLKEADIAVREAKKNAERGGCFFINGDHHIYKVDEAVAMLAQRLDEKRAKEKHFKKLCYEFVELGGEREVIDELIHILNKGE